MPYILEGRKLRPNRPFKNAEGLQFPANWLKLTSDEEKAAVGITWEPEPVVQRFDSRYYYSAGNPRPVADGTDEDGNEYTGLKTTLAAEQATIAGQILSRTDWYAVRKAETSKAIPTNIKTYRAAVRTACDTRQAEIAAVSTTAELEALMKAPAKVLDSDGETLIDNPADHLTPWPDPVS